MQQADQVMLVGDLLHQLHHDLILIAGAVGQRVDRRQLVLAGRHFIVLRLCRNAQLPAFLIELFHEGEHSWLDDAEIVIVQLLCLWRAVAKQRTSGIDEVFAFLIHLLIDQKVFLFCSDRGDDAVYVLSQQVQQPFCLLFDELFGFQQRCLFIQGFPAVREKDGRNAERTVLDEGIAAHVPGGIASRLKGGTQASVREAGGIGFAFDQLFAGQLHDDTVTIRFDKAVMLFGGDAGHRLEPVGVMGGAELDRPFLHFVGDDIRIGL